MKAGVSYHLARQQYTRVIKVFSARIMKYRIFSIIWLVRRLKRT
jgi:hypothetical protein